ncbi:hypothetical protein CJU76_13570 [Pseudomonas fragi]|nr:hypothetical protein CJU76_13570 [Pseudomonas fragi]
MNGAKWFLGSIMLPTILNDPCRYVATELTQRSHLIIQKSSSYLPLWKMLKLISSDQRTFEMTEIWLIIVTQQLRGICCIRWIQ